MSSFTKLTSFLLLHLLVNLSLIFEAIQVWKLRVLLDTISFISAFNTPKSCHYLLNMLQISLVHSAPVPQSLSKPLYSLTWLSIVLCRRIFLLSLLLFSCLFATLQNSNKWRRKTTFKMTWLLIAFRIKTNFLNLLCKTVHIYLLPISPYATLTLSFTLQALYIFSYHCAFSNNIT